MVVATQSRGIVAARPVPDRRRGPAEVMRGSSRGGGWAALEDEEVAAARSRLRRQTRAQRVRRYSVANRLTKLGTLTYAGEGCRDPRVLRRDVADFMRNLRSSLGGADSVPLGARVAPRTVTDSHVQFGLGGTLLAG